MRKAFFKALAVAFVITVVSKAQTPGASQLLGVGGIAAENGGFAFLNNLITAYSAGNIRVIQGTGERWSDVQIAGKSVSYELKDLSMKRVPDNVPIAVAHEFQFCDSFDQVSR